VKGPEGGAGPVRSPGPIEGADVVVETIRFVRGRLPHWLVADRPYFVTLRLKGTLPNQVLEELARERQALADKPGVTEEQWSDLQRRQFLRIESILHSSSTERDWLARPEVAELALHNLSWLEENCGWSVYAAVIMSNHMHLLLRNAQGRNGELLKDLGSYKSYTGQEANRTLQRKGAFWAREDFDHWCRTPEKTAAAARYICRNPVAAGLARTWREWPWVRCQEGFEPSE
jgi:REP element-mobilizing transposase RayT